MKRKLYFSSDHGGADLKFELIEKLKQSKFIQQFDVLDLGVASGERTDYPIQANLVASQLKEDANAFAIIICGTGIGISIAANRYRWVRAALVHTEYEAQMARAHNNANTLALGGRVIGTEQAWTNLKVFLTTEFEGERHAKRVDMYS